MSHISAVCWLNYVERHQQLPYVSLLFGAPAPSRSRQHNFRLSVSFIQMLKAFTPVSVLLTSALLGIQSERAALKHQEYGYRLLTV